jgi:hypothetical protein
MPIPQEISQFFSALGAPVTATALAIGLVRGARALETDANPHALKYVAGLLTAGDLASFGKLGPALIPFIFDRVFGPNPFRLKFISRSILATTIFWISLEFIRGVTWLDIKTDFHDKGDMYPFLILSFYIFDWLSLIKARFIIHFLSQRYAIISGVGFLIIDLLCSYLLAFFAILVFSWTYWLYALGELMPWSQFGLFVNNFIHLGALRHYLGFSEQEFSPIAVVVPSTMLTSLWTVLLIVSGMIAQLLNPLDYLRRFTAWWFRDIETRPLTAIAKVGAALIVLGSVVVKASQWI